VSNDACSDATPNAGYIGTDAFEVTIVFDNDPIHRDEYTAQILQ